RQRRVFTNDDVRSAPAPAPTPAPAPAAAPQPAANPASPEAAASREAGAETPAAAAGAAADEPGPVSPSSSPKERLQRFGQAQVALRLTLDEFAQREQEETDPAMKARWQNISACMVSVMQGYQEILTNLQEQVKQLESAPAAP
ncbi:MAG: hypothetical protein ACRD88_10430, partial [Terriglobia bacterium]